jgi:hypothetical protein
MRIYNPEQQYKYNTYIDGADFIGMGSKISQIKTQKKEIKLDNPMSHNQNNPAHIPIRRNTSIITHNCS